MLLKQGAEAKIYKSEYLGCPCIVKERFVKKYRHPELDSHLTKERIKAECRAIVRCKAAGIRTPTLYGVDLAKRCIYMEYIENAKTLKECISNAVNNTEHADGNKDFIGPILERIGVFIGRMHSSNIIHGDLTTSNILLVGDLGSEDLQIIFIDFGLSSADESAEDKGVDLYVLERAIISAHTLKENVFNVILKAYAKEYKKGSSEVLRKLDEVRSRGRKRLMVG
ncbi:TP53-regulating kinase [Gryllus bimaculatus]|nr:TP53-regulating kinase [Gryllus bimaculatus]